MSRQERRVVESNDDVGRRRWLILSLIFAITVINFIDRQTLSVLAPVLCRALNLSNVEYGRIVSALQFGLMSGEFPMGYLMDRWGARLGMAAAVMWWSGATGAQVFARNGLQFGLVRFWMGTGECGNYSGGIKTVTRLFTKKQRTLAIGIFNGGSMVGATLAPPIIVLLMKHYGFRAAFLVPAIAGALWVPSWWFLYGREVREEESTAAQKISLSQLLKTSSAWAVMACRFFNGPVLQFYWYWIPSYLVNVRHLSMMEIGALGWIPFFLGSIGGVVGGWAAGLLQRYGLAMARVRHISMYGSGLVCIASLAVPYFNSAVVAMITIGIAMLAANFFSANMFAAVTDLFPVEQAGRATGLTGFAGGLSGLLFPLLTGWTVDHFSYKPVFLMVAFMPLLGAVGLFAIGRKYRMPELSLPAESMSA